VKGGGERVEHGGVCHQRDMEKKGECEVIEKRREKPSSLKTKKREEDSGCFSVVQTEEKKRMNGEKGHCGGQTLRLEIIGKRPCWKRTSTGVGLEAYRLEEVIGRLWGRKRVGGIRKARPGKNPKEEGGSKNLKDVLISCMTGG